jgi:hypothetical protein
MTMQDLIREGYWPSNSIPTLPVTSGLEFYLDASVAASVDVANQLWKNLVSSPASGAAQTDYDFQLGANTTSGDSDEPLHVGTPTSGHPFAYWNAANGDYFDGTVVTPFIEQLSESGAVATFVVLADIPVPSTRGNVIGNATGSDDGVNLFIQSNGNMLYDQQPATSNSITSSLKPTNALNFFGFSWDEGGGANASFFFLDNQTEDFDGASGSHSTSNTPLRINQAPDGGDNLDIGTKYYAIIAYNTNLTKSEVDKLYRHFQEQGRV